MRMIRQASLVAGRIMELKQAADPNPLLEVIQEAYDTVLDVDPHQLEELSDEAFQEWLVSAQWHSAQFELLATLLQTKGEYLETQGEESLSYRYFGRAIYVLEHLGDVEQLYSLERRARIINLRQRMEAYPGHQTDSTAT